MESIRHEQHVSLPLMGHLVIVSMAQHLKTALTGRCKVMAQGMRVRVPNNVRYYYPDVVVARGPLQIEYERGESLLNPLLVVEVLSPTTERRDRGIKLRKYRTIPSLCYYLLVSASQPLVEIYQRAGDEWLYRAVFGLDAVIDLSGIGCVLRLSDLYDQVEFSKVTEDEEGDVTRLQG